MAGALLLAAQDERLTPLEWLVGEWEGKGKYGTGQFEARFTYAWTLAGKSIKFDSEALSGDRTVFRGTGMLGWDLEQKKLVEFGFGMDGTIGWGRELPSKEKDTWVFEGRLSSNQPQRESPKTVRRTSPDTCAKSVEGKKGDEWIPLFRAEYARKKE